MNEAGKHSAEVQPRASLPTLPFAVRKRDLPINQLIAAAVPSRNRQTDLVEPKGQELLYSARVSLNKTQMLIDNRYINLAPGMAVTVEIRTGSRRLIEYLMSPLLRYQHESLRER